MDRTRFHDLKHVICMRTVSETETQVSKIYLLMFIWTTLCQDFLKLLSVSLKNKPIHSFISEMVKCRFSQASSALTILKWKTRNLLTFGRQFWLCLWHCRRKTCFARHAFHWNNTAAIQNWDPFVACPVIPNDKWRSLPVSQCLADLRHTTDSMKTHQRCERSAKYHQSHSLLWRIYTGNFLSCLKLFSQRFPSCDIETMQCLTAWISCCSVVNVCLEFKCMCTLPCAIKPNTLTGRFEDMTSGSTCSTVI